MLSPFKNLLNQFFMPGNGQASVDGEYIAAKLHARQAAQPAT